MTIRLSEQSDGSVMMRVKVVPGSSRDRIVGQLGEELKIAVSRPAEDGQANAAVVKLLAAALGIAVREVTIVAGHSNPRKQIQIRELSAAQVLQKLGL